MLRPADSGSRSLAPGRLTRALRSLEPRRDRPLPAWMIFPILFALLYLTHWKLLPLPYFWDEAGYYIPAAWDFFRTGSLIPTSTLTNAHPPLPSVYLALWWWASGFAPVVTREAVLIVSAFGLTGLWQLCLRLTRSAALAFWTVLLTALYPIWFAQSTLAHADIFAAACTLWALVYALPDHTINTNDKNDTRRATRRLGLAALWFSLAALSKETAIATPFILAALELADCLRAPAALRRRHIVNALWLGLCLIPLAAWYIYHYTRTGFLFGNPEFLRYNATATLSPLRILLAFGHRLLHLTSHMNMFVPVLCTTAALMLDPIAARLAHRTGRLSSGVTRRILFVLLANAFAFSLLGGALLTRYLLPMYPLVLLIALTIMRLHVRWWHGLALLCAAAFVMGLFVNPPYGFAPEDNLTYAHIIRLHEAAIHELYTRYPGSTVLTAWPVSDELTRPELGYVKAPFSVYRIEDFTPEQIQRAAEDPSGYSTAIVFSTKEDPPPLPFHLSTPAMEERFFGLHHDMGPRAIAQALGGDLVWQQNDGLDWVALLRFHRSMDAANTPPTRSDLAAASGSATDTAAMLPHL